MRSFKQNLMPNVSAHGIFLSATVAVSAAAAFARPSMVLAPAAPQAGGATAYRAGTIHAVEGGAIYSNGVIVVEDGKISAIGSADSVEVPAGATSVDYGSEAVIIPGLVAVDSAYTRATAGPRTADPTLLAIDQFDPYSPIVSALKSGITTAYLAPARGRLIAGQGAVVKTGGGEMGEAEGRVMLESAGLHGSISEDARRTPGYWEPPVPATVDVGLGVPAEQLPRTTMGAVLAFDELMALAGGDDSYADEYGPRTGPALAKALKDKVTWRLGGETPGEVRALLDLGKKYDLALVIDGASRAASLAEEISAAGYPVIARPHFNRGANTGKAQTSDWPTYDAIARLAGEGVQVAIAAPSGLGTSELRFAAALAMRGGLSEADALAGVTLNAAKILGVADRVGSLAVGKDADLVVMTGSPMSVGSAIVATVIDGSTAWSPQMAAASSNGRAGAASASAMAASSAMIGSGGASKSISRLGSHDAAPSTVVISVDELHVGNGVIHKPGEILVRDGKIAQVAAQVGRPAGATVVRGAAAMPGMIDAYGHLGTEGGGRPFSTRFDLSRILEPGDYADRQVAARGVTTVNLISKNLGGLTPSIAYKPAARSFDSLVIDPVASVRMEWDSSIVTQSGESVKKTLQKAKEYTEAWAKYEEEIAKWTPPAEEEAEEEADADEDEEASEEKDDDKKKKKKKKERDPAKSVTGVFEGTFAMPDGDATEGGKIRLRFLEDEDGSIEGSARISGYSDLLELSGSRDEYDVTLQIDTPDGDLNVTLAQVFSNDPEPKKSKKDKKAKDEEDDDKDKDKGKDEEDADDGDDSVKTYLRGEAKRGDALVATVDVTQVSEEFKVAKRVVKAPKKEEKKKAPKGKPKEPSLDPDLEPIRRAMQGTAAVLVSAKRDDQILACVSAFEEYGIKPVLVDSDDVHKVAAKIAGRVSGVLIPMNKMTVTQKAVTRNRLVEVAAAGIPVAFLSQGEEGAAELGVMAARAVSLGLAPSAALKGLTSDAAQMLRIDDSVGTLEAGKDADILVLDGSPLEIWSSVSRVFVNGTEVH